MLGHKASLSKLKKVDIISTIFSNHIAMGLEINYMKKALKKKHKHVVAKPYATEQPTDQ